MERIKFDSLVVAQFAAALALSKERQLLRVEKDLEEGVETVSGSSPDLTTDETVTAKAQE